MLPFSRILEYGNVVNHDETRYIGIIPDTEFSYTAIQTALSPTATLIAKQADFRSYMFQYNGVVYILPSQPIAFTSYKEVYEKGMVWGSSNTGPDIFDVSSGVKLTLQNATTQILGSTYKIRLMRGSLTDTTSILVDNPKYVSPMTEWELFVYSIWSNLDNGLIPGYDIPSSDKVPHTILSSGSSRRWALVQGSDGNRTSPRSIGRGRFDGSGNVTGYGWSQICSTSLAPLWTTTQNLWWPIFEKI